MQGTHALTHAGWTGSITAGNPSWSNYSLSVSIKPSCWASEYDGVSFAITETGRYAVYVVGGNQLVLGKWVNGTWTRISSAGYPFDPSLWYTLTVVLPGGVISVYVNGTPVLMAPDSTFSAGAIGFESNDPMAFDNVVVAPIGVLPTPSPSPVAARP
jgi:hypothetical protein